jgi:hypothetical protein
MLSKVVFGGGFAYFQYLAIVKWGKHNGNSVPSKQTPTTSEDTPSISTWVRGSDDGAAVNSAPQTQRSADHLSKLAPQDFAIPKL